jgi:YYY domain-containing protein
MEFALVLRWLVGYAVLGAVGWPLAARLFPRFSGRGVGFAVPVALVVLTTVVYYLGHVSFGPLVLLAGVVGLLAVAGLAALDRGALRDRRLERSESLPELDRRVALETAAVFAVAFLFVVAIRAVDPAVDPLGGEKFLDFGLLKSLHRSTALPPEDMWFAGEPVRYYYGGHLVSTILARLLGTPPRFAYNLALAGFYAMLVAAVYELAGAVAADRGLSRRLAGLASVFFVGFASNLDTVSHGVVATLPRRQRIAVAEYIAARSETTVDQLLGGLSQFSYWGASRVIPGTINEFPLFAWLNGDLHAHMMGTPFLLLAAALGYSYVQTPAADRRRRLALVFVAVPVVGGLQAVVDTWSFPTVFGLLWLAATFAPAHPLTLLPEAVRQRVWSAGLGDETPSLENEVGRTVGALFVAGASALLAVVVGLPFFLGPGTGGGEMTVELLSPGERSTFGGLLLVHGAFVLAFATHYWRHLDVSRPGLLAASLAGLGVVAFTQNLAVLAVTGPLVVFGWVALRLGRPVGYETVLVVGAAGLVTIVEFLYLSEQAGPVRMNTVFKTYMQVWVLWGTAAGVVVAGLVEGRGTTARRPFGEARRASSDVSPLTHGLLPGAGTRRTIARLFVVGLVLSTSVYGAMALPRHFDGGGRATLDATAYVEQYHPGEAPAIAYLDGVPGQPTLLSAPGTSQYFGPGSGPEGRVSYSWKANPASSLTGVPTVVGWRHEIGYRGADAYFERVRDVDAIYTGSNAKRVQLLREYDVRYIWVGPAERDRYGEVSFQGLDGLTVAERTETVTLYRVDQSQLDG